MDHSSEITWKSGMAFDVEVDGHHFPIDADAQFGGTDAGPKPKPLVLSALGGCTAMDVTSILAKMRVPFDSLSVKVEASLTEEHPKYYDRIKIIYSFTGNELDAAKIDKAVDLSQTRYCGVNFMLGKTAEVSHEIRLNP